MTRFLVIGDGRSGSTWLADMIRQHPRAACLMEPLAGSYKGGLYHHRYYWPDAAVWRCPKEAPVRGTYKYMGKYFDEKVWAIPKDAVGAKLLSFYFSWYRPSLPNYLRKIKRLKVVWIERNPLRKVLSEWYAQSLHNWNVEHPHEIKRREPSCVPWDFMRRKMVEYDQNRRNMDQTFRGRPICRVHYHNLLKHLNDSMDEVCRFLNIEPRDQYTTVFQRMTPQPFKDLVLNWRELKNLTPAPWRKYWERDKS